MAVKKTKSKNLALVVVKRNNREEVYPIDKPVVRIGTSSMNEIVLNNRGISPFHAKVTTQQDTCTISNLGAHEGVKVNGNFVETATLAPGDEIEVGNAKLRVTTGQPPREAKTKEPRKKEARKRPSAKKSKRKVAAGLPGRVIIILGLIFLVLLVIDIHWLISLLSW